MNENIYPNHFKRALLNQEQRIGCWSALASPITTEILGLAGFDWILLDGEHAPNDIQTFIPQLMALKDSRSVPVVRPPVNDPVVIKRLLDIGFYNLIVPFVETQQQAETGGCRYPLPATGHSRGFRRTP
ncbi:aldolase/citrate lyase family protein [Vibrio sp. CDRSL-10 TSBA]